jgi:hypothetical protein
MHLWMSKTFLPSENAAFIANSGKKKIKLET